MRCELAKQMKIDNQLVKIEDETIRYHKKNCQVKVKPEVLYAFWIIFRSKSGSTC